MMLVITIRPILSYKYIYAKIKYDEFFLSIKISLFVCIYNFWLLYIRIVNKQ